MKKKWFGLLLVCMAVLSLLPIGSVPAFASSDEPQNLVGENYFENQTYSGYREDSLFKVTEDTSYTTFYNCTFIDVTSDSAGSCFYFDSSEELGANISFENCRFINCHSKGNGGAFYFYEASNCTIYFLNCVAINCSAENGGFLCVDGDMENGRIFARNFYVSDCKAETDGGFLYANDNNVKFDGDGSTVIFGCYAGDEGGAVYSGNYDGIKLENLLFADNRSKNDGGAIYDNSDGSVLKNCRFYRNIAGDDGGAVYIDDGDGKVENCAFFDNGCTDEGKELYSEASGTHITDCRFTDTHDVSSRIESGIVSGCVHKRPFDHVLDPAFAGTEDDPYPIRSVDDWDILCYVNENISLQGKCFRLETDLTVCTSLGRYGTAEADRHPFEGFLDGNDKKIGICTGEGGDHRGLIGYAGKNAVIRNLTVRGSVTGSASVGGIVGYAENCRLLGCIGYAEVSGNDGVGGIVGCAAGGVELVNCVNFGAVSSAQSGVGGIVGKATGGTVLKNCVFCGKITHGASGFDAILGASSDGVTAENCYYLFGCCDVSAYGIGLSENAMTGKAADRVGDKDLIMPDVLNAFGDENRIYHDGIAKFIIRDGKLARGKLIYFTADDLPQTWGEPGVPTVCILAENATADERVKVLGEVTLILKDGCTLTASRGITLEAGNTLIVHGCSDDPDVMGKLIAAADTESGDAGIGGTAGRDGQIFSGESGLESCTGEAGADCGTLILYGGYVSASGEVGFGGGRGGNGSNGPYIYDSGANGGNGGNGGTLSVIGGRLTAKGTLWAIGGGEGGIGGKRGNDEGMTGSTTHDGYPGSRGAATVSDLGGVNTVKVGNDRENCEFADSYRSEKYCEYFYCDHTWESFSGMTHQCSSCGMTGSHADEDGDRICDLCKVNIRVTVRYHMENEAACILEFVCSAGDVLWDRIRERVLDLQKDIAGQLYADGSLMKEGDRIPAGTEYLDLYAVFGYPGAAPTCTGAGHKAYYYSSLSCTYCADVACKQTVGDGEALKAWLSLTGAGYIAPLGHTDADFDGICDVCEDLFCGHENVEVYYGWDIIHHAYCDAVLHCPDCGITHTERSAKVDLIEEIAGKDCLTKGTKTYRATFPTVESTETTEYTVLGDHIDGDRNGWCDICGVFAVKAYETVTESTSVLTEGSWIVNKSVQFDTALTVSGTVTLYLADDTVLTAACGILLTDGNSLTVCAQSDGDRMGVIRAGGSLKGAAGIGGDFFDSDAGALTVNGGYIKATGGYGAKGIGGGFGGKDGTFTKNGGNVEVINGEGYVSSHEHTYSENWSCDSYYHWHDSTCEHTGLTSGFGAHTFGEGVVDGNVTIYTCTECGYRKFVYNPGEDTEGEIVTGTTYTGISLTLGSDISINFYMELSEEARQNGTMTFDIGGRVVTGVTAKYNETEKKYYFQTPLTALEMNETVIATFNYNGVDYVQEYSVADYIDVIVGNPDKYGNEAVALAKKIANYGHYAQTYLASIHKNVTIVNRVMTPIRVTTE